LAADIGCAKTSEGPDLETISGDEAFTAKISCGDERKSDY